MKILETKVLAGAAGAGIGGAVGNFLLWILGVTLWHSSASASASSAAVASVPPAVSALLAVVVPVVLAAVGGYVAPHTLRPDLTVPTVATPDPTLVPAGGVAGATLVPDPVWPYTVSGAPLPSTTPPVVTTAPVVDTPTPSVPVA